MVFENKKILIIDDSEAFLTFLRTLLSITGATVDLAKTGEEGFSKHDANPDYDLILLDLLLPDMNGLQILEQIRIKDDRSTVVILTGDGDVKTALTAIRNGADGYVEKQDLADMDDLDAFLLVLEQAIQYRAGITAQKELQEKLQYLSLHDTLTGLYNREYFQEEFSRLKKGRRFPVSVLMADVNWLKRTNDELGHPAGDELLQCTAQVLKKCFRAEDTIARIGGDEFAVLLPDSNVRATKIIVERVQGQIDAVNQTRSEAPLSLAIGAATAETPEELPEAIKQADEAMYRHKEKQKR